MFQSFKMTGRSGEIRRGAVVAATLGDWSLTPGSAPETWVFTARSQTVNAFHIHQNPDVLSLAVNNGRWRWRGVAFEIGDGNVRATLRGAPEDA